MKRNRYILLIAATVAALGLGLGVSTAAAGPNPADHVVEVTKTIEGEPGDTHFVVDVCGQTLDFDESGGTQSVNIGDWFDGPQTCIVSEPDDGGATDVEIKGSPCEFTGQDPAIPDEEEEVSTEDETCEVKIENDFEETPTTTTTVPEPPVIVEEPAPVIVVAPQFTG